MTPEMLFSITKVLSQNERVIFAYIYGSAVTSDSANDIDIAVYSVEEAESYLLSADLQIALHKETSLSPEIFDIRILNGILEHGNLFALLYLKKVLRLNHLLTDKNPDIRSHFLEKYSLKYRECEGLFQEVLA